MSMSTRLPGFLDKLEMTAETSSKRQHSTRHFDRSGTKWSEVEKSHAKCK